MSVPAPKDVSRREGWFWLGGCGLILIVHLVLLCLGSFARSYDAWTHLFFASHWQQSWWSDFEPRWYGGFSVFTYPPLSHQSLALPGKLLGLEGAFVLMQTLVLGLLGLGIWRYTRIWFSERAAWLAALLGLALPSLAMTVHLFGQYPNTVSLALVLNLLPWVARWLMGHEKGSEQGDWRLLLAAELLLIPAALTSLFTNVAGLGLFALPVLVHAWQQSSLPLPRRALRLGGLLGLGALTLATCLWPVASYLRRSPVFQEVIPHASRNNVLFDADSYFTFYGLYGPLLLLLIPLAIWLLRRKRWDFLLPGALLLLLSTGGATPLNQILLGPLFRILTFDRFAFWNTLLLLPPLAAMLVGLHASLSPRLARPQQLALLGLGGGLWLACFGINAASPFWKPLAALVDPAPLILRLEKPDMRNWRFMTLGLGGNNLAAVTSRTATPTIDGNYNFGRRLPALNQAPIALLDEAKYYGDDSVAALAKFLADPQAYQLRWVLLKDRYYTPLLQANGWILRESLGQDVQLWESRLPIEPLAPAPAPAPPTPAHLFWGLAPLSPLAALALLLALTKLSRNAVIPTPGSSPGQARDDSKFSSSDSKFSSSNERVSEDSASRSETISDDTLNVDKTPGVPEPEEPA